MPDFMGIELNIGCPSPKVMSCGWGAGMMRDRPRTIQIIKDIVSTTQLPFSIKTRAWLSIEDKEAQRAFILDVAQYCKHIIIHGRTYKQSHSGDVDWQYIYDIKRELWDNCIIMGNWWVKTYEEMIERFDNIQWHIDWVMIWQAAIGRPRIFTNTAPTLEERYEIIVRHAKMMIILYEYYFSRIDLWRSLPMPTYEWLNNEIRIFDATKYDHEKTMIEYRKYLFNYISWLPGNRELKVQLATTKDYDTTIW
jgi:tRNA-dihydrouridine synthase